ncbi:MAG: histidine phosphatase family protein [Candidatus Heimdallarchaeota archaeon]|nr:histidine phosphatase family protein [Candidatus Heimdallarchaeota archaeon]
MRVIFVRHGESTGNRDRIIQGQKDFPLTEMGREQARIAMEIIKSIINGNIEAVYSSPLGRALETASIIRDGICDTKQIIEKSGLMEASLGTLEGEPLSSRKVDGNLLKFWDTLPYTPYYSKYNIEPKDEFLKRAIKTFEEIIEEVQANSTHTVLIVSHYGVLGAILSVYLDLVDVKIANTEVIVIENDGERWNLVNRIQPE